MRERERGRERETERERERGSVVNLLPKAPVQAQDQADPVRFADGISGCRRVDTPSSRTRLKSQKKRGKFLDRWVLNSLGWCCCREWDVRLAGWGFTAALHASLTYERIQWIGFELHSRATEHGFVGLEAVCCGSQLGDRVRGLWGLQSSQTLPA